MDPTVRQSEHVFVRGGMLTVVSGEAESPSLEIGSERVVIGRKPGCSLVLNHREVSGMHVELGATPRGLHVRDLGSTNGTYLDKQRVGEVWLTESAILHVGPAVLSYEPGKPERLPLSKEARFGAMLGATSIMRVLFERAQRIARSGLSVLLQGETGTGKELLARAIREASTRSERPFRIIDCSALHPHLAESVLFGHVKGAYTDAAESRVSEFVEATGGTVFLDEFGELPLEVQAKLLRLLDKGQLKPLGSNRIESIDVRIIAATNRDLLREINEGRFRSDLYWRVRQALLELPPLRERTDDIPVLVRHILRSEGKASAYRRISPASFERLAMHAWPGNVRELQTVVRNALAFDEGGAIDLADHLIAAPTRSHHQGRPETYRQSKHQHDQAYFTRLFDDAGGNVTEMARLSGLERPTIRRHLRTHKIRPNKRGATRGRATKRRKERG